MPRLRTRITRNGQITLPKVVRDEWGLQAGEEVEVEMRPDGVLLHPHRVRAEPAAPKHDPDQAWFWTAAWQEAEREADADIRAGRVRRNEPGERASTALRRPATPEP